MRESGTRTENLSDPGKEARQRAGLLVVPAFDGYRAFAILGVVQLHLLKASGAVETGDSGFLAWLTWATVGHAIEVLFVVSGFVVFLPTAARDGRFGSLKGYAIRRAARLFPAYWMILALILVLLAATSVTGIPLPSLRDVAINFTGLHVPVGLFVSGISTGFGVNPATWTLSVEICFYLVLPLVAGVYFRHPWIGLLIAGLVTVGWNEFFLHLGTINVNQDLGLQGAEILRLGVSSSLQLPSWAFSFALGMSGAWMFANRDLILAAMRGRLVTLMKVAGGICLAYFAWRAGLRSDDAPFELVAQQTRSTPWLAIGFSASLATVMVAIALRPGAFGQVFSNQPVRWLGDISYGIFLSHLVVVTFAGAALSLPTSGTVRSFLIWTLVVVPISVLYGYLSARFLEQPIRRWARRYGRRDEG